MKYFRTLTVILIFGVWTYVSTRYLITGTDLFEYWSIYLAPFLLSAFLYESILVFYCCKLRKTCERTYSLRIGTIALFIIINFLLYLMIHSLNLKLSYKLFQNIETYISSFYILNPFIIFISLYRYLKGCLLENN